MIHSVVADDLKISLNPGFQRNSQVDEIVIVGEEENGLLIYTWTSSTARSAEVVTHIGIYNRQTKLKKEIYVFDRRTKVVNATLSCEESFLAFVTLEQSTPGVQGIYAAYIAEVRPANHLYSLSLESSNYVLLQFINGTQELVNAGDDDDDDQINRVHLLVVQHKKSVGVYHLPTACVEDKGLIMSAEPEKDQLLHKWIVWAEWNMTLLRLSVLQQKKKADGRDISVLPLLTIYQFKENGTYKKLMHLFVDLPINYFKTRLDYLDISPCKYIPVRDLNLRVLQHTNGTICVCYQQPSDIYRHRNSKPSAWEQRTWYNVLLPHCGEMLQARFSQSLPPELLMTFAWLGERLLVHIPGVFSHLLNVNIHCEPVHHLLWRDGSDFPIGKGSDQPLVVLSSNESPETELYDRRLQCISRVTVSDKFLVKMFEESEDIHVQLSVLRYAFSTSLALVKKLFDIIKHHRIFFRDMSVLFEEFLIGSTFELFRQQMDTCVLSFLPFSSIGPVSVHTIHAKPYCYSPVWNLVDAKVCKCQMASLPFLSEQKLDLRFNLLAVKQQLLSSDLEDLAEDTWIQINKTEDVNIGKAESQRKQNAVRFAETMAGPVNNDTGVTSRTISDVISRTDQLLGVPPSFIDNTENNEATNANEVKATDQVRKLLGDHLRCRLPNLSPMETLRMADKYVTCQLHSSKRLLHILWSICTNSGRWLGKKERTQNGNESLLSPPTFWEIDLLKYLECYYLVTDRLSFPRPSSFSLYFFNLVFRCRTRVQFLHHVEYGAVFLHRPFCKKVCSELDDNEENVKMKMQFLHHLSDADLLNCYKSWNHPYALQLHAQHFAASCVTSGDVNESVSLADLGM